MTKTLSYLLPDKTVKRLQRGGKRYAKILRSKGRHEWYFGTLVNSEWGTLPDDAKEEIRMSDFYAECSQWINSLLPFPVVGESGETLRRWCEVAAHYETFPNVAIWREVLSFDHFDKARSIGADLLSGVTSAEALAMAVDNNWTADEMKLRLQKKTATDPAIIELRKSFPPWVGHFADPLARLNGRRAEAENHLRAYVRLVEEETK